LSFWAPAGKAFPASRVTRGASARAAREDRSKGRDAIETSAALLCMVNSRVGVSCNSLLAGLHGTRLRASATSVSHPQHHHSHPGVHLTGTSKAHDLRVLRVREHSPSVPEVRSKRMGDHRITPDENVTPGLDVSIPEDLASPHPSPRSAEKAHQFDSEWKVQPDDHVGTAHDEIAHLALTDTVDDPAGLPLKRLMDSSADLLDGRLPPVSFVLDRVHFDKHAVQELREPSPQGCLPCSASSDDRDPPGHHRATRCPGSTKASIGRFKSDGDRPPKAQGP